MYGSATATHLQGGGVIRGGFRTPGGGSDNGAGFRNLLRGKCLDVLGDALRAQFPKSAAVPQHIPERGSANPRQVDWKTDIFDRVGALPGLASHNAANFRAIVTKSLSSDPQAQWWLIREGFEAAMETARKASAPEMERRSMLPASMD